MKLRVPPRGPSIYPAKRQFKQQKTKVYIAGENLVHDDGPLVTTPKGEGDEEQVIQLHVNNSPQAT